MARPEDAIAEFIAAMLLGVTEEAHAAPVTECPAGRQGTVTGTAKIRRTFAAQPRPPANY